MAQTRRITYTSDAPTTEFNLGADIVAQSQSGNYSVVRVSAQAINRGFEGSYSNYQGKHVVAIDGYSGLTREGILPSGVGTDVERWDISKDIKITHDSKGNKGAVTLRQTVTGWHESVKAVSFGGFPRIPKPPSAPGKPTFSELTPTSVRVSWAASTDNGGDAIDGYLLRYWPNAAGTGAYTNVSSQNDRSRVVTGLTPGIEYRFAVYAYNGSDDKYSPASSAAVTRTLSGMWVKVTGVWKRAIPYLKVAGVWKPVTVFGKVAGFWKRAR